MSLSFIPGSFVGKKPKGFKPSALFLDMDGTTIVEESLEKLIQDLSPPGFTQNTLTEDAMEGKISFSFSLIERVKALKGYALKDFEKSTRELTLEPGIEKLCESFKKKNLPIFILTGGLDFTAQSICKRLGAHGYRANQVEIINGKLTGKIKGTLLNGLQKKLHFEKICLEEEIDPKGAVMIGDGANDKKVLEASGLAVGFKPREILFPCLDVYNGTGNHHLLMSFLEF